MDENNNVPISWPQVVKNIKAAGIEIYSVTSGKRGNERETWWWNEGVQEKIKEKKMAYKQWQRTGSRVDKTVYKEKSLVAKREVTAAKRQMWED